MTYLQLILNMTKQLKEANQNEEVAFFILFYFSKDIKNKLDFLNHKDELALEKDLCLNALYEYINLNKPLSKITHEDTFYRLTFNVLDGVFSPRSETELLVEVILKKCRNKSNLIMADICAGTGIIGLSINYFLKPQKMFLVDINELAIKNIEMNANNLKQNVSILHGDLLEPLLNNQTKIDVLVSNPPYIDEDYQLDKNIETYDPKNALFANEHGIEIYRKLLTEFNKVVNNPNSYLIAFEIGFNQGKIVKELAIKILNLTEDKVEIIKDYNGLDRIVVIDNNF